MQVIDAAGASSVQPLQISISGTNDTPIFGVTAIASDGDTVVDDYIPSQKFSGAGSWSYQIPAASFTDAEGVGLTYSVEVVAAADGTGAVSDTIGASMITGDGSLPSSWLTFDAATRTFSGNPSVLWGDAPLNLKVTATDSAGLAVSDTFTLTLTNTGNQLPTVQNPLTWKVATDTGAAWNYPVPVGTFFDAEGNTLIYSAYTVATDTSGVPTYTPISTSDSALKFVDATLSGNGTADSSTIIEIRVTDGNHGASYAASQFQLVVNTTAPTGEVTAVTGAIPTSVAFANGSGVASYTVPAAAFDIAGSTSTTVSYAATLTDGTTALPGWLSFNTSTGTFSGNPPNGTADLAVKVTATVGGNAATAAFTLGITDANDPLVVTAHLPDRTVTTGSVDFTVPLLFSDPDGGLNGATTTDGITYSATLADDTALPGWLVFNETTRAFSGNPPAGTPYLNIKVTGTETVGGSTTATSFTLNLSDASAYAAAANNLGTVTITGTAALGNTLTATAPVDADGHTLNPALSYQWQASSDSGTSWTDVLGARGLASTLTLAQTESHQQVRVQAFYNDNGGFAEAPVSNAVTVPAFNVAGVVTISGALSPGKTLLATVVDANGLSGGSSPEPAFQWYRGVTADFMPGESNKIAGATNSLYTLVIDDGAQYLKAVASYTDAEGTVETPAGVSGQIQLGPLAPVAANDTPADVTENYGALNAAVVSTPPTGNLLSNDTDANAGDTKTLTELRLGGVEGIGTNATVTDSGTTLTMVGRYGTLVVTSGTVGVAANAGQYTYTVDQNNVEVEALLSGVHLTETFNYSVMDSAELSDTGVLTLTINGANDLLAITGVPATLVVTEDVASNIDLSSVSLNDVDHAGSTFKLVASQGTLAATGTTAVTVGGTGTDTLTLVGTNIAIQDFLAVASNIQYTSALNDNGTSGATLTLTGDDGVSGFIALGTVALDITAINDAPAGADKSVTVLEDVTYTFAAADFGFSDVFDTFADAGSGVANVLKSVLITTLPSNGKLQLSGVDVIAGTSIAVADLSGNLKFVPVANENNQSTAGTTEYVTFTFQVQDDGGSSGIELDQSPNIFTVNVTPVNDAPVLQNAGTSAPVLVTIDENAIANTGHLISTLVRAVDGTNPTDNLHSVITDVDFATQGTTGGSPNEAWDGGIAIYDLSNTGPADGGKWQYKLDSTWVDVGTVSETQALLLRSTDSLRFLPDADNATTATVSYYVWDGSNTTTAGTLVSVITANRGGTTAFSTASDTATITVTPVNDAPTLDLDGNNSSGANGASYITTFLARGAEVAVVDGDITILDVDQNSRTDVAQQDRISKAVVLIDPALAADNMLGTIDETLVFKDGDVAVSSWSGLTITGNGTGDSGLTSATELTITGPATWATYQGALQKVFYNNTNLAPTQGDRTVSITVTDNNDTAGPNGVLTATATTTVLLPGIAVVDLNGPLAAGANFTVTFTEGDLPGKAVAATNAAIDNQGGLKIKTVTLSLSNSPDGNLEKLFLSTAQVTYLSSKGITVQNNDSHAVTLAATDANVGVEVNFMNTGLRYVQYVNSSENPDATARVVNVSVQDMGMVGQSAKSTITVVPVNDAPTGAVTITNDTDAGRGITAAQQNDVLSVTNTLADLDGPATLTGITYQWQSGGVNVSGATGSTYTLTQADVGKVMTVVASYTDASATVEHKTSAATNAVVNVNDAPVINAIAQTDLNETISTVLTANIPITFTDIDPLDVGHTASVSVAASGVTTGLALDATQLAALMTLGTVTKASGSTAGSLTPVFSATATAFDYLAAGEVLTLTYTLTVADVGGPAKNDTKVFVIQITGTNDEPVITAADLVGAVTEQVTPSGNLTDTGSITFTDVDLTDMHLVSASGTYLGSDTALGALTAVKTADTTGTGAGGALSWTYSVAASAVEYLAAGEPRIESFTITLDDQNGSTITKQIDVTITGTNDVPVITAEDLVGAVTEQFTPSGNLTDTGSISFTDVDLTDVHLVSASGTYIGSDTALGTLTAVKTADTTGSGGALSWTYTVADSAVEYLAAGEPRIESFTITLNDQNGSVITKQIDVTITGTNDVPVLAHSLINQSLSVAGPIATYTLAADTFADIDQGTVLSYTAQVWNSSTSTATTLPDWLHFDAGTRTFSGNPPAGSPSLTVRVTASDGALTATGDFTIALPDTHVNDVHLPAPAGDVEIINNLILPQTLKVTDVTDNSKVTTTGTGNTTVDTPAGDIAIGNAGTGTTEIVGLKDDKTVTTSGTGPTTVENPAGDVTVDNTGSGDVKVNGANDGKTVTTTGDKPVTVSNPDGDVKVNNTGTGTSTVTDVKDGKTVTTSGTGPTTVENPAGNLTVDSTGNGLVKVNGANDNTTVTATGTKPVTISNPDGNVNVVNDGTGLVTVSGVQTGSTVNSTGSGPQTVDLSNLVSGQSVTIDNDGTGLVNLIHVPAGVTVHFTGSGPTTVSSLSGDVTLDNQGTSLVTVANDATIANGSTIHTTGTGPIKFDTDIPTGNTVHVDIAGNSNVTFDNDGAGTLDVTGATNATLTSTSSGPMTVTDPVGNLTVNNTGKGPLVVSGLDTGKELTVNGNGPTEVKSPDGDVTVTNNGTGLVNIKDVLDGKTIHTAGTGPIIINTELGVDKKVIVDLTDNHNVQITNTGGGVVESQGDLTLDSTHALAMTLTGKDTTVLTETGTVALNNAPLRLNLATGYTPMVGEIITLIANDSTDAVFGTFAGLPEGTVVHVGAYQFTISYVGGTGNDVVLTVNSAPTGSVFISGTPTQGDTLTATNTLADINVIPTSGTGAISYQWQADGVAINGATASTFVLTQAQVAKAVNVVASYIDGIGSHESQVSASTMVHTTASGSTPLAQQSVVSTVTVTPSEVSGATTTSLVSAALSSGNSGSDVISLAQHTSTTVATPSVMTAALGVFDLGSTTGSENFSLYVDSSLGVNGYWVQNASGTFVNLASAAFGGSTVVENGKTVLNFTVNDGSSFDANTAAQSISSVGAAAHVELSFIGHTSTVSAADFF